MYGFRDVLCLAHPSHRWMWTCNTFGSDAFLCQLMTTNVGFSQHDSFNGLEFDKWHNRCPFKLNNEHAVPAIKTSLKTTHWAMRAIQYLWVMLEVNHFLTCKAFKWGVQETKRLDFNSRCALLINPHRISSPEQVKVRCSRHTHSPPNLSSAHYLSPLHFPLCKQWIWSEIKFQIQPIPLQCQRMQEEGVHLLWLCPRGLAVLSSLACSLCGSHV